MFPEWNLPNRMKEEGFYQSPQKELLWKVCHVVQGWSRQEWDDGTQIVPFPARRSGSVLTKPFPPAAEVLPCGFLANHPNSWAWDTTWALLELFSPSPPPAGHRCPPARSGHRCVADSSNLYVFGGYNPDYDESGGPENEDYPLFRELWRYNFATDTWHQMGTEGYMPRELASMSRTYGNPTPCVPIPGAILILAILIRPKPGKNWKSGSCFSK